ncbi:MAG: DNA/RNA non-specific endonuclease [Polyangiaceae bacterium]|nr:DNA/RNA non-specific endonuclease [Polyangiaceae bacterium]
MNQKALLLCIPLAACAAPTPHPETVASPPNVASAHEPIARPSPILSHALAKSGHVLLGIPKRSENVNEVLLDRGEFVMLYDESLHSARWVAWRVTRADIGKAKRKNAFHPDPDLPSGFLKVTPDDYAHSGFDRGHLCPSGDRTATPERNHVTFLMTNMQPQRHALNGGPWEKLEEETRARLMRSDDVAYVVAGGIYAAPPQRIGRGVAVPSTSFKVVVWLHEGEGPTDIRRDTPHAAVLMPNAPGIDSEPWETYRVTIDRLEQDAGVDVLSNVPLPIQTVLEASL